MKKDPKWKTNSPNGTTFTSYKGFKLGDIVRVKPGGDFSSFWYGISGPIVLFQKDDFDDGGDPTIWICFRPETGIKYHPEQAFIRQCQESPGDCGWSWENLEKVG